MSVEIDYRGGLVSGLNVEKYGETIADVLKENGKLRRENEMLRVDNALLYDQNDRLQMANRGIMIGVRRVVEGQLDLF